MLLDGVASAAAGEQGSQAVGGQDDREGHEGQVELDGGALREAIETSTATMQAMVR